MSTDERLACITAALLTLQELLPGLGPATLRGEQGLPDEELDLVCGAGLSMQTRVDVLIAARGQRLLLGGQHIAKGLGSRPGNRTTRTKAGARWRSRPW